MQATETHIVPSLASTTVNVVVEAAQDEKLTQAAKIDKYFSDRDLPLSGYGLKLVVAAEKYDLDWNLLPAIAMRESTGGKFACHNNPFGWGSCSIKFKDFDEAIEVLARNLGGANKKTAGYYAGVSTAKKLYYYNGTVIKSYPAEVMAIMKTIEKIEISK